MYGSVSSFAIIIKRDFFHLENDPFVTSLFIIPKNRRIKNQQNAPTVLGVVNQWCAENSAKENNACNTHE